MSQRVPIPCPNCGRGLRIRVQNLGRQGNCSHCGHLFRAQWKDVLAPSPPVPAPLGRVSEAQDDSGGPRVQAKRPDIEPIRGPFAAKAVEHTPNHDPAPLPNPRTLEAEQAWESAQCELGELRAELSLLQERLARADQLEQALRTERTEVERLRAHLLETHSYASQPDAREVLPGGQEPDPLRDECDRLRGEVQALRSQLEVQSAVDEERLSGLANERDAARAELERAGAERDALEREVEQTLDELGAQRDALVREVEQIQEALDEREQALAEAEAGHDEARVRWEEALRESEARWEQQCLQLLAESEGRLAEQRDRFEAERLAWDQQCEEHAQFAAEWEALAREVEQVQARLVEDRDALAREVNQLRDRASVLEQAKAEAEAEFHSAGARWDAERMDWRQQSDGHARTTAERDALLREVEQLKEWMDSERDEWARGARQLRDFLDEQERSRAEADSERNEALARLEAERQELRVRGEHERQGILEDIGQAAGREQLD
jgi:hypothetical protein